MKTTKPVSRSTFQKKAEECKRLKRDIYEMVMNQDIEVFKKWRKQFKDEEAWTLLIREIALTNKKNPLNHK